MLATLSREGRGDSQDLGCPRCGAHLWHVSPASQRRRRLLPVGQQGCLPGRMADGPDAWALGHQYLGGGFPPLVEQWNGTEWSIEPSPPFSTATDILAFTPSDVWTTGIASSGPGFARGTAPRGHTSPALVSTGPLSCSLSQGPQRTGCSRWAHRTAACSSSSGEAPRGRSSPRLPPAAWLVSWTLPGPGPALHGPSARSRTTSGAR